MREPIVISDEQNADEVCRNVTITEGVRYVADMARAHWQIDAIIVCQKRAPKLRNENFQI